MENENLREQMAEILNGLTEEQKERAKACKTMEELMTFLSKLGAALPDELLDAVAGGRYDDLHWWERTHDTWLDAGAPNPYAYFLGLDWD